MSGNAVGAASTSTPPNEPLPVPTPPWGGTADDWCAWATGLEISRAMNLRCVQAERGRAVLVMETSPWPLNATGAVHGGLVVGAIDQCLGIGAVTATEGVLPATASLTANYVRPALAPLRFEVSVTRTGRVLSFLTVEVTGRDGRLCVIATAAMAREGSSRLLPG